MRKLTRGGPSKVGVWTFSSFCIQRFKGFSFLVEKGSLFGPNAAFRDSKIRVCVYYCDAAVMKDEDATASYY